MCEQGVLQSWGQPRHPLPQNAATCFAGPAQRSPPAATAPPPAAGRHRARPGTGCDTADCCPGQGGWVPAATLPGALEPSGARGCRDHPPAPLGPTWAMSPSWHCSCLASVPKPCVDPSISWEERREGQPHTRHWAGWWALILAAGVNPGHRGQSCPAPAAAAAVWGLCGATSAAAPWCCRPHCVCSVGVAGARLAHGPMATSTTPSWAARLGPLVPSSAQYHTSTCIPCLQLPPPPLRLSPPRHWVLAGAQGSVSLSTCLSMLLGAFLSSRGWWEEQACCDRGLQGEGHLLWWDTMGQEQLEPGLAWCHRTPQPDVVPSVLGQVP